MASRLVPSSFLSHKNWRGLGRDTIFRIFTNENDPHSPTTPVQTLVATTAPPVGPTSAMAPTRTTILMTLVRLVSKCTDLVITINLPYIESQADTSTPSGASGPLAGPGRREDVDFEQGRFGNWVEEGLKVRDEVHRSLEINDWSLFVDGGNQTQKDEPMEEG